MLNQSTFESGELDGLEVSPRAAPVDELGFVEAVDGFGERIVGAVADASDGEHEAGFRQALGVLDRQLLNAPITVVNEAAPADLSTRRRSCSASSSASRTKPACAVREARQPTICRAKGSMMKAT